MGDFSNRLQILFELLDMKSKIQRLPRGPFKDMCKWQWKLNMAWVLRG